MRVAFAASPEMLDLDAGWPLLRDAVAAAGGAPSVALWEDPAVDWASFDAVVAIYTWGYVTRRERFVAWADAVAAQTRLVNAAPVVHWNSDKAYLADLEAAGVPTVPTTRVPPGAPWEPPGRDYVVKPSVASGGIGAARYVDAPVDAAREHVTALHATGQTALVQPYVPAVDERGETALVFFADRFSHAVRKGPVLEPDAGTVFGLWERQAVAARTPGADERALAERALHAVRDRFGATTYARVDVVAGVVMEVELIEPSLFLHLMPYAAPRLARAVITAARRARPPAARPGTG